MNVVARLLAFLSLAASGVLYVRIRAPMNPLKGSLWILRLFAGAVTPFVVLTGTAGAVLGLLARSPSAAFAGLVGAFLAARDVRQVTTTQTGFEQAFGGEWEQLIPPGRRSAMLKHAWTWRLPLEPEAQWQKDVPFWTLPGSDRQLICDLWQPPVSVAPSGLALVYVHGGAWSLLDKDFGTRAVFRHLAEQGHVIMDVAFRMYPETDMLGMVGDVKRAIAWIKEHGPAYGVSPERVVVAGASSGGYLALLAAYTPQIDALRPDDVGDADLRVRGVISCYGPADLRAYYDYTRQDTWDHPGQFVETRPPGPAMRRLLGASYERLRLGQTVAVGATEPLLGGTPDIVPHRYELFSPTKHVQPECPATLLMQGKDDVIAPITATNRLHSKLVAAGVPAVNIVFPHAEHGFDLILPRRSPTAQTALYYEERFLALLT